MYVDGGMLTSSVLRLQDRLRTFVYPAIRDVFLRVPVLPYDWHSYKRTYYYVNKDHVITKSLSEPNRDEVRLWFANSSISSYWGWLLSDNLTKLHNPTIIRQWLCVEIGFYQNSGVIITLLRSRFVLLKLYCIYVRVFYINTGLLWKLP